MRKIKFIDVSRPVLSSKDRFLFDALSSVADVVMDDASPEVVFDLGYGFDYMDPCYDKCIKVAICSENLVPDFSWFDYVIGFDFISFGDRYLRYPFFARWNGFEELCAWRPSKTDEELLNRGFCSFVVSNGSCTDPFREEFYRKLSKYKPIASGGKLMNNVGGPVADKLAFCARYKFNIAFENSVHPGYVTEKIVEPLSVDSVPIYYGDPLVQEDFNPDCMIRIRSRAGLDEAIDKVVAMDKDDDLYLQTCRAPRNKNGNLTRYNESLSAFLRDIMSRTVDEARRAPEFGYQMVVKGELRKMRSAYKIVRKVTRGFNRLFK